MHALLFIYAYPSKVPEILARLCSVLVILHQSALWLLKPLVSLSFWSLNCLTPLNTTLYTLKGQAPTQIFSKEKA